MSGASFDWHAQHSVADPGSEERGAPGGFEGFESLTCNINIHLFKLKGLVFLQCLHWEQLGCYISSSMIRRSYLAL